MILRIDENNKTEILSKKLKREIIKEMKLNLKYVNNKIGKNNVGSMLYGREYITKEGKIMNIVLYFESSGMKLTKEILNYKSCIKAIKKMNFEKEERYSTSVLEIEIMEDDTIEIN